MKAIQPTLLFLLIFITACTKKSEDADDECAGIPPPVVTAENTTLTAGQSISIVSSSTEGAQYYLWSGPNGFTSNERDVTIDNAQPVNAGVYTLEVGFTGGCILTAESDSIAISLPAAECNPSNNTANIAGVNSIQFYSITGAASGGSYFITANGTGGDLELEFPGTDRPQSGVYTIRGLGDQFLIGDVRVRLVAQSSNWPASSGKVHLNVNNDNKLVATFCSVPVTGQTYSFNTTASGRVTEE